MNLTLLGEDDPDLQNNIINRVIRYPKDMSENCKHLIDGIFDMDPHYRFNINSVSSCPSCLLILQILLHPWLKN